MKLHMDASSLYLQVSIAISSSLKEGFKYLLDHSDPFHIQWSHCSSKNKYEHFVKNRWNQNVMDDVVVVGVSL